MSDNLNFEINYGVESRKTIKDIFKNPLNHINTGMSYMLPFIVLGGFASALGQLSQLSDFPLWSLCATIGSYGMLFFVPFFGAYIGYSIGNKPAIAPAFIASYIANENGSGYLGALISGMLVGYFIEIIKLKVKVPEIIETIWDYILPVISGILVTALMYYGLNGPINSLVNYFVELSMGLDMTNGLIVGLLLGAFGGIDFGGPISKIGMVIMFAGFEQGLNIFVGIGTVISAIPALGVMMATIFAPKLFDADDIKYSKCNLPIVFVTNFSEFALPIVTKDILRCTLASFIGCTLGGGLAGLLNITQTVPVLGIPALFFCNNPATYFICMMIGSLITAFSLILLKKVWR
ncbi:MAG: hypothetical protein VB122_08205 [Erysipelotrichales bacterium]|nr:hypothetical protein [Erysipelotrichales bacterium]